MQPTGSKRKLVGQALEVLHNVAQRPFVQPHLQLDFEELGRLQALALLLYPLSHKAELVQKLQLPGRLH